MSMSNGRWPGRLHSGDSRCLAARPGYRSLFEAIPFSNAVKDVLGRLSASVDTGILCVELKQAIGREWDHAADQLTARLMSLPDTGNNLLIIIDELPLLLSRMLRAEERKRDAELLLSRLRSWRQAPELHTRVCTLVGGSIGLEGVLRRSGLSGSINDLSPFRLDSWDRPTAVEFLKGLGSNYSFRLNKGAITHILDLLRDPVPYHVQLFFAVLRDACKGQPSRVSSEVIERCFAERLAGASGTAHLDHYATRLEVAFDENEHKAARDILSRACWREDGVNFAELEDLQQRSEQTFRSVLRDLEADGYMERVDSRMKFRSNLLREWWRKYHRNVTS